MSPTYLELAVAIVLIIVAWQIGLIVAPMIFHQLRSLKHDLDEATDAGFEDTDAHREGSDQDMLDPQHKEEHTNGTHR